MKKTKLQMYDAGAARDARDRWVTMSNALTRAGHGLTLSEKRIIATAVSKLDSRRFARSVEPLKTRITAAEYGEAFGLSPATAYEQLKQGAKHLFNRSVTFYEAANKRRGKPLEPTKVQIRWVGSVRYQVGEGWVELSWWHEMVRHLTGLQRQFTTYQLQQASALRSVYSWRLLELLTRFEASGWAEYSIDDFRQAMDAPSSLSDDFGQVKRRVIEPAVRELTLKDGWVIDWKPIKAGRKVKAVRFEFLRHPQGVLPL